MNTVYIFLYFHLLILQEVIDDEQEAMEVDTDALEGEPDEEGDFVFGLSTILNLTLRKVCSSFFFFHDRVLV